MCFHQWARTDTKEWLHVLLFEVADGAVELQSEMEDHFIRYAAMATACKQKVLGMGMFSGSTRGVYAAQDLYLRAYEEAHRELESICCATTETCCTWTMPSLPSSDVMRAECRSVTAIVSAISLLELQY